MVDFVKKILFEQKRVRLVGVCFGHQIIGRALGQKVGRSEGGWEISVTPMQLTEKGREVFGVEELVSFFFFGPSFTSTCVTGSISATSCLRNPPLTGHSPNAPGRSLHLSALGRTLGSLSKLPCSGHV